MNLKISGLDWPANERERFVCLWARSAGSIGPSSGWFWGSELRFSGLLGTLLTELFLWTRKTLFSRLKCQSLIDTGERANRLHRNTMCSVNGGWIFALTQQIWVPLLPPGLSTASEARVAGMCLETEEETGLRLLQIQSRACFLTAAPAFLLRALKSVRKEDFVLGRKDK